MLFKYHEIAILRAMKLRGDTMAQMCDRFCGSAGHTREDIVEALDAIVRHRTSYDILDHVNRVLHLQSQKVPLINGQQASSVLRDQKYWEYRYQPMFT